MRRLVLLLASAAALAACAETRPPHMGPVAMGPGEWRVSAAARDGAHARLRALRRAAELTLSQGGDWFRVRGRDSSDPDASGAFIGMTSDLDSPEAEARSGRSLDIRIGRGPKPEGAQFYDAHEVAARLGGGHVAPRGRGVQV